MSLTGLGAGKYGRAEDGGGGGAVLVRHIPIIVEGREEESGEQQHHSSSVLSNKQLLSVPPCHNDGQKLLKHNTFILIITMKHS